LGKLAALYEREVDQSTESLSSALQPILTLILAGLILAVLLGLYMPIFKSTEALSGL
jgi:type II secretory pathway component PulF